VVAVLQAHDLRGRRRGSATHRLQAPRRCRPRHTSGLRSPSSHLGRLPPGAWAGTRSTRLTPERPQAGPPPFPPHTAALSP
jgi:hypothetical protein